MTFWYVKDLAEEFGVTDDAIRKMRRRLGLGTWINNGWVFTDQEKWAFRVHRLRSRNSPEGTLAELIRREAQTSRK